MPVVHIEYGLDEGAFRRQYARYPLEIGPLRFSAHEADRADWLAIASYKTDSVATHVPRDRRILIVTEPNGYFPADYVNQFGILVSPFAIPTFRGVWHQDHGALPAYFGSEARGMLGRLDYQALASLPVPVKRDAISVVVSRKTILAGHRKRLEFVRHLGAAMGDMLEVYGRGARPVIDKADVIFPNKYHLVLENTVMPSYWTEKLADAWLGHAFPFVSGPPDLARWFPPESFLAIDIDRPESAIAAIQGAIADDIYEKRRGAIAEARRRVLQNERVCPLIARVITANPNAAVTLATAETIRGAPRLPLLTRLGREAARVYWQVDERMRAKRRGA